MNSCVMKTSKIPCKGCASALEEILEEIDGVELAKVDYDTDTISVYFKEANIDIEKLKEAVEDSGYRVKKLVCDI